MIQMCSPKEICFLLSLLLSADLAEKGMMIADLGDTVHIHLRRQFLDLRASDQQIAHHTGSQVFFLYAINKFNGAKIQTGLGVS